MIQVKAMKKVHVSVSLSINEDEITPEKDTVSFSFIFGIGRDGLTPFECSLQGCRKGDQMLIEVNSSTLSEYFGGLVATLQPLTEGKILPINLTFAIEIQGVEDVENREVVAALAGSASGCGGGGSCGCGCS